MTAREDTEEKPKVKLLSPGFGIDKSRLHGSGFRSKGFAITDLLGLESDLQVRQQPGAPPPGSGSGPGAEPHGGSGALGGFSFPGGSLPLGLGFLCSLAAQQPAGAPCFLPGHLPLLQARAENHYMQNLEAQRDAYSGTARPGSARSMMLLFCKYCFIYDFKETFYFLCSCQKVFYSCASARLGSARLDFNEVILIQVDFYVASKKQKNNSLQF